MLGTGWATGDRVVEHRVLALMEVGFLSRGDPASGARLPGGSPALPVIQPPATVSLLTEERSVRAQGFSTCETFETEPGWYWELNASQVLLLLLKVNE